MEFNEILSCFLTFFFRLTLVFFIPQFVYSFGVTLSIASEQVRVCSFASCVNAPSVTDSDCLPVRLCLREKDADN